ncbi:hypothetical protein [Aestuariivirga sp.]|jgi:hypothetical protein|uniref:hypothetical protein n=1 Tax=Aestuariivirga sp. TaxID=2650926 RepID=UPI003782EA9F
MKYKALLFAIWLCSGVAFAGDITSAYTRFALETDCRLTEQDEEQTYAFWLCPGYKGIEVLQAYSDDRAFVGFGADARDSCAFRRTFTPFNSALSPIEWRLRDGKPFAVIERWRVSTDDQGGTRTWLVVTALQGAEACHVHYVEGAFPRANEEARRAADELVPGFDCQSDEPSFSTTSAPPPIAIAACSAAAE